MGMARQDEARRRATEEHLVSDSLAEFLDIPIPPGANAAGKTIAELNLPLMATLVSIRRDQQLLIPHGLTRLHGGDVVTVLSESDSLVALKAALTDPPNESEQDGNRVS